MSEVSEDQTAEKSAEEETGCPRPKKRRRGKKKRFRNQANQQENAGELDADGFRIPFAQDDAASAHRDSKKRAKRVLIRPVDVPKAPENSTQFIMDDHDECHLYVSFETPNPYRSSDGESKTDDYSDDAAFQDIDYQYESLQDADDSAYYIQDFELSYFNMRYEELLRLPRQDLINALENLEVRLGELEDKLFEQDPGSALEQLQHKLLQLQEENTILRDRNLQLKSMMDSERYEAEEPNSSAEASGSVLGAVSHSTDSGDHSYDESENSQDSSQHSEDDSEDFLGLEGYSQDDTSYLPDYDAQLHISHENLQGMSSDDDEDDDECVENETYANGGGEGKVLENGVVNWSPNECDSTEGNMQSMEINEHTVNEDEHFSDEHVDSPCEQRLAHSLQNSEDRMDTEQSHCADSTSENASSPSGQGNAQNEAEIRESYPDCPESTHVPSDSSCKDP